MRVLQLTARLAIVPVALAAALLSWLWLQQTVMAVSPQSGGVLGETSASANVQASYACNSGEWRFTITGLPDAAPRAIVVTFANGAQETLALSGFTNGTAEYATGSNLDAAVTSAEARVQSSWNGGFTIAHGPINCTEVAGIQTTGPEPGEQIPFIPVIALYPAIGAAAYGIARFTRRHS